MVQPGRPLAERCTLGGAQRPPGGFMAAPEVAVLEVARSRFRLAGRDRWSHVGHFSSLGACGKAAFETAWHRAGSAARAGSLAQLGVRSVALPARGRQLHRWARRGLRMASARERELLVGFPRDNTLPALRSGEVKADPRKEAAVRLSLVGNLSSVPSTALVVGRLLAHWGYLS